MALDMENPIRVNFATMEELQRIIHFGLKVAYAIITLRESHGNLTLATLQTFLRTKFDAETLEMLDFTRNVGLPFYNFLMNSLISTEEKRLGRGKAKTFFRHQVSLRTRPKLNLQPV